jgi:hypothetical protein
MKTDNSTFIQDDVIFTIKELHDAVSCTAMCIVEAIKQGSYTDTDWAEYLLRWNEQMCFPEETLKHINTCIYQSLNRLKRG